jgi:hypothetical protein
MTDPVAPNRTPAGPDRGWLALRISIWAGGIALLLTLTGPALVDPVRGLGERIILAVAGACWVVAIAALALAAAAVGTLLERIACALERAPAAAGADPRQEAVEAVKRALAEGRWDEVDSRLESFAREHSGTADLAALTALVAAGRQAAVDRLKGRLEASRQANDPNTVLGLRDELARMLPAAERELLDRELIGWLLRAIQKRMRSGTVGPDVALLAGEVAARFGETPEGASLKASLPVLRRSGGLCPRCAGPYIGFEAACPQCLAKAALAAAPPPPMEDGDGEETEPPPESESPFLPAAE